MAKFYGVIGYATTEETKPDVWVETITERKYYGDIIRASRRVESSQDTINDGVTINNVISIVADPYAQKNIDMMRYVKFRGTAWKITSVEIQYPRLNISIGGIYNGKTS
nr:MAG TPA: hypothetical protein [Bacteriophage sp.]